MSNLMPYGILYVIVGLILDIIICAMIGESAQTLGKSFAGYFVLSLLLSPIMGMAAVSLLITRNISKLNEMPRLPISREAVPEIEEPKPDDKDKKKLLTAVCKTCGTDMFEKQECPRCKSKEYRIVICSKCFARMQRGDICPQCMGDVYRIID
jgi:hypothetical protein